MDKDTDFTVQQINSGRLKHLEMLQQVIIRMANNSFFIKGWSITLLSAILVVTAKDKIYAMGWIALIPVVLFWLLDGFFLRQERLFRKLYDKCRLQPQESQTDFNMDTSLVVNDVGNWMKVTFSTTLIVFHGGLTIILLTVLLFINHQCI